MDWQLLFVVVLVMLAISYLAWQTLRTWRGKGAGCGGCKRSGSQSKANSAAEMFIPLEQIRLRRR